MKYNSISEIIHNSKYTRIRIDKNPIGFSILLGDIVGFIECFKGFDYEEAEIKLINWINKE